MTLDRRYLLSDEKVRPPGRFAGSARDRLTEGAVFLKTAPRPAALHEWETLLSLPPGLAPRPLDLRPWDDGQVLLVQEQLAGCTLQEAAGHLRPEDRPNLAISIGRCLQALHRAGFVHADLKPANIFLESGNPSCVRLIDLGSARSPHAPAGVADDPAGPAVTPPFVAPELMSGWSIDGRADLYSLGIILSRLGPVPDPVWDDLLARLTADMPSARFADAATFCRTVARRFGLQAPSPLPVRFAAGPLRGRAPDLARMVAWATDPAAGRLFLVQARRGTGLTRFLRQGMAAAARAGAAPPPRVIDLGELGLRPRGREIARAIALVEECLAAGERIILGVPHPSPGLYWPGARPHVDLSALVLRERPQRLTLPPLGSEDFGNLAGALPIPAGVADLLGAALCNRTEGDLHAADKGATFVLRALARKNVGEDLSGIPPADPTSSRVDEALRTWKEPPFTPRWVDVPTGLRVPLQIVARAASPVETGVARSLLERFGFAAGLETLVSRGFLLAVGSGQVVFVRRRLREAALSLTLGQAGEVDAWLHTNYSPPIEATEAVIEAARRARSQGDPDRERFHLRRAVEAAARDRHWLNLRALLSYPQGEWTEENATSCAGALHMVLGDDWSLGRLLHLAGETWYSLGSPLGVRVHEICAGNERAPWGLASLVRLAYADRVAMSMDACERRWERIEALRRDGFDPVPGIVEAERANYLFASGRRDEAHSLIEIAARKLAGSGLPEESDLYLLRAVLSLPQRPEEAIATLHRGLDATRLPAWRAMMYVLLSQIHELCGHLEEFERSARLALEALSGGGGVRQDLRIRAQLAWSRFYLDRAREAGDWADQLLDQALVQREPLRRAFLLALAGLVALHQGRGREAIARLSSAWEQKGPGRQPDRCASILRHLLDALLDLDAWDVVREYGGRLVLPEESHDASVLLVRARAAALRSQADQAFEEALARLEEHLDLARQHALQIEAARYLHHLGCILLELPGGAPRAAESFRQALDRFGATGFGYYRTRSLLGLARAHRQSGDVMAAGAALDESIALARRIGSAGVLANALQNRAAWRLFPE